MQLHAGTGEESVSLGVVHVCYRTPPVTQAGQGVWKKCSSIADNSSQASTNGQNWTSDNKLQHLLHPTAAPISNSIAIFQSLMWNMDYLYEAGLVASNVSKCCCPKPLLKDTLLPAVPGLQTGPAPQQGQYSPAPCTIYYQELCMYRLI